MDHEQEQEQDLVVVTDDDGNELTLEVLDYFFYEGQEYAILVENSEEEGACECESEDCECCHAHDDEQQEAYIMRVVPVGDDQEEFIPVEDDMLAKLIDFVQNDLYTDEDEDDDEEFVEAEEIIVEEDGEDDK